MNGFRPPRPVPAFVVRGLKSVVRGRASAGHDQDQDQSQDGVGLVLLFPIAVATLRRRWSGFAGSFVALALGVALLSSTGMLTGTAQSDPDPQAPSLYKLLIFASGAAAFVSVFVVANTFAFAVAQRRRETALLRAVGATPRQVQCLILGEALGVAVAASVTGALAGLAFAPGLAAWLVSIGAAPHGFAAKPALTPLLVAALVEFVVALAGAAAAAFRAGAIRPVEALREAAVDRPRMSRFRWVALVHHVGGAVFLVLVYLANPKSLLNNPGSRGPEIKLTWAMIFSLVAITAVVIVAPLLVPQLVRVLTLPVRLTGGAAGLLARQNALTSVRRTVATAIPAFVVVATLGCVVGGVLAFNDAFRVQDTATLKAPSVAAHPLSADTLSRLRSTPGVQTTTVVQFTLTDPVAVLPSSGTRFDFAAGPIQASAVDGDPGQVWNLRTTAGTLTGMDASGHCSAAVSADLAKFHGWQIGDRVTGTLDDGFRVDTTVAAIYRPPAAFPEALLTACSVGGHLGTAAATTFVTTQPGTRLPDGLVPAHDWLAPRLAADAKYARITMIAIVGPTILYALVAIVNTMVMSTSDRRRDFRALHRAGTTRAQLLWLIGVESALVTCVAALLGAAVTVAVQYATTAMINHGVLDGGPAVGVRIPWTALSAGAGVALLLAVAASVLPVVRRPQAGRY